MIDIYILTDRDNVCQSVGGSNLFHFSTVAAAVAAAAAHFQSRVRGVGVGLGRRRRS